MCRYDLLNAVTALSSKITKWDENCDKALLRVVRYLKATKHHRLMGWVGDKAEDLCVGLYADADFAGCNDTCRSTSGVHLGVYGPSTNFALEGNAIRQNKGRHTVRPKLKSSLGRTLCGTTEFFHYPYGVSYGERRRSLMYSLITVP